MPSDAAKRKLLRERWCRLCERPATNTHHLLYRSHGGDDVPENLIPLCGSGTTGCHGKIHAHDPDARELLAMKVMPEEMDYLVGKLGGYDRAVAWLGRVYGRYPHDH